MAQDVINDLSKPFTDPNVYNNAATTSSNLMTQATNVAKMKQEMQQKREEHELKKFDYISDRMQKALLAPPKMRKLAMERLQGEANSLGIAISPENLEAMQDEEIRQQMISGLSFMSGLPDDERSQMGISSLSTLSSTGDVFLERLGGFSNIMQEREAARLAAAAKGKENGLQTLKSLQDVAKTTASQQNVQDAGLVIQGVNNLNAIASDPQKRKEAKAGVAAKAVFARILDPKGVVRESDIQIFDSATQGIIRRAQGAMNKAITGEPMSPEDWRQVTEVANILGQQAEGTVQSAFSALKQNFGQYAPQGFDFRQVSGVPQLQALNTGSAEYQLGRDKALSQRMELFKKQLSQKSPEAQQKAKELAEAKVSDPNITLAEKTKAQFVLDALMALEADKSKLNKKKSVAAKE